MSGRLCWSTREPKVKVSVPKAQLPCKQLVKLWTETPQQQSGHFCCSRIDSRISIVRSTWRSARDVSDADQFDCGTVSCWTHTSQVKQYPCEHVLGKEEPHVDSDLCDFICQWHNLSTEDFLGRIALCHICGAMKVSWRSGPFLEYHILGAAKMPASW